MFWAMLRQSGRRFFGKATLHKKLISLCVCAIFIPSTIQLAFISKNFQQFYLDFHGNFVHESLRYCCHYLSDYISGIESQSNTITNDLGFINLLTGRASNERAIRSRLDNHIKQFFHSDDTILSLAFWTSYDHLRTRISRDFPTYSYNWSTLEKLGERYAFSYEELSERGFLLEPRTTNGRRSLTAVWAIPNNGSEPLAVMIAEYDCSAVDSVFSALNLGEDEVLLWVDERQQLMHYRSDLDIQQDELLLPELQNSAVVSLNGKKYIVFCSEPFFENHQLIRLIPYATFMTASRLQLYTSVLTSIFSLFVTLIVIIYGIRRFTSSFQHLQNAMSHVEDGDFQTVLQTDNFEVELKPLLEHFNRMTQTINRLITEKYEATIEQQKAEMRALQAQINPHFLYNTLQMLDSMALKHNAYEITVVVNALGEMMRYCLQTGEGAVRLCDEVENIKRYLTIQKLRFIKRLRFSIQVDSAVEGISIPRMTLQPLVENCIVHGISDQTNICDVFITARQLADGVEIEVRNTGRPIANEKLAELTTYLFDGSDETNGHIGLKNCYLRLKYFFGDSMRFTLSSTQETGTCVRIYLYQRKESNL